MRTVGYRAVMGEVRLTDDPGDPWGSAMAWLFPIAEVFYVEFGECLPEFRPSPMLSDRDDIDRDDYQSDTLLTLVDSGEVTETDLRNLFTVMSRYADWARLAGKDY